MLRLASHKASQDDLPGGIFRPFYRPQKGMFRRAGHQILLLLALFRHAVRSRETELSGAVGAFNDRDARFYWPFDGG